MRKLLIQPQARLDLLEIWHYISRDNINAANRVSERLDAQILGLLDMPGKGHKRADVNNPRYRFWRVYSYIIAYRYDNTTLTIVRIVHGRRDFRQLLHKRP
jgi:plasmid stabilization system protein ParE